MSLRVIIKRDQIRKWIEVRHGQPARRRNTDADLAVLFDGDKPEYVPLSVDEMIEAMRANHLVLLVDQEPDKTFYRFIKHG